MRIGIGTPNSHPSANGLLTLEWAKRAEACGLASVTTIGRVAYPTQEELVSLAGAAAVTTRIGLMTDVLLGPTRDPVLLAKQAATLDQVSGGRFILGTGVGNRPDDFQLTGTRFEDRGRRWDESLDVLHRVWRGDPVDGASTSIAPRPTNGTSVPMMFGGASEAAVQRVARWGIGYTATGGAGVEAAGRMFERVRSAWAQAGRPGAPICSALFYFALGRDAEQGRDYLSGYYGPAGDQMWPNVPRDADALRDLVAGYEQVGADELVLVPTLASPEQVDLLAEAVS